MAIRPIAVERFTQNLKSQPCGQSKVRRSLKSVEFIILQQQSAAGASPEVVFSFDSLFWKSTEMLNGFMVSQESGSVVSTSLGDFHVCFY